MTDGNHNRVLQVKLNGTVTELIAFAHVVPTGLAVHGDLIFVAQAGPVPHLPEDGKVVAFGPWQHFVWEVASGGMLIVEATSFGDEVWAGMPKGSDKRLTERFTVSDDSKSLDYRFALEYREYLSQPASGSGRLSYRQNLSVGGMECDADAASRFFREFL